MIRHALFPTLVGEWSYEDKDIFKSVFLENALQYFDKDGRTNELTGHIDLHLNSEFQSFFEFVGKCGFEYLDSLSLNLNLFNINIVKTWLSVSKEFHVPEHCHGDVHLSFVYYIQVPKNINKFITFKSKSPVNELFHGVMDLNTVEWNLLNSSNWSYQTPEGTMFMFPGYLDHRTVGDGNGQVDTPIKVIKDLKNKRIALAGDIVLTYKEKIGRAYGLTPTSMWRTYQI